MAQNDVQPQVVMPFEEEKSNFDIMEWVLRIIRHWYLFVIAGVIAFSLAYLKNKSVIERYLTTGTMIIQESGGGGYGAQSLMHGFVDNEKCDYDNVLEQLQSIYGSKVVPVQYPLETGPNFNAVIDVLLMKKYSWGSQLSTRSVRNINHLLCGCATAVIQKNHLSVIMRLFKPIYNEREGDFNGQ